MKGKNPISNKSKLFDYHVFEYVLKPKEWQDNKGLLSYTNILYEDLETFACASQAYHDNKKAEPRDIVRATPYNANYEKFVTACGINLFKIFLERGTMWGPGTKESLINAIAIEYPNFIEDIMKRKLRSEYLNE